MSALLLVRPDGGAQISCGDALAQVEKNK